MMGSFNLTRIVDSRPAIDDAISLAPVVLVDGGEVKVVDEPVLDAVRELGGHHLPRLRVDPVPGKPRLNIYYLLDIICLKKIHLVNSWSAVVEIPFDTFGGFSCFSSSR